MKAADKTIWHELPAETVLLGLNTGPAGLDEMEARNRLRLHGANALPVEAAVHPLRRFLAQFDSALIYALLAASVAAALLGHHVDAIVIVAVVLINAVVGFVQEGRAQGALAAIRDMIAPHALVLRNGIRRRCPVSELVPGDIVSLKAGDRVPADVRLLRVHGLRIDEAALTGESVPAEKVQAPVAASAQVADRSNMAFSGTLVSAGRASGVVVATGPHSQIGRIGSLLQSVKVARPPLLSQIDRFARRFTALVAMGALALFAFAIALRGYEWGDALLAVVALAVGIIPEGLPAVISITLAIGVQRMARRNAVIRRLPAVETLGAVSVICSDKTGTLTRNEMTVRRILIDRDEILVGGSGYAPEGGFTSEGGQDDAAAIARAIPIIACGLLCNDATLAQETGRWWVNGDPMEGALVALAAKAGLDCDHARSEWKRIDEIPFDASYRFMATLNVGPGGEPTIFIKGAPEEVMAIAGIEPAAWAFGIAAAARDGERLLGFARKRLTTPTTRLVFDDLASDVEFLGLMGFVDPPRPEAAAAIAQCRRAGIAVKMITGDHAATALAIARQLGIADEPHVTTGSALERLSDAALSDAVLEIDVFARTNPEHKLRIVRALQYHGLIVAMTGDGVNDAPSLKQADVGTAMGDKGTEAAKEAAGMVLLDDNFASIVAAVREGRTVHDNIRKVIAWTLPTNGGEALAVVLAILAGFTLPMTPTQILWINLICAVTLGLALALEPSEPGVMDRAPRHRDAPLISSFLLWRTLLVSLLLAGLGLGMFFQAIGTGRDLDTARTIFVNTLVVGQVFYLFNVRYLHMRSMTWHGALGTPAVLGAIGVVAGAQLLFTYAPFMHAAFASRPMSLIDWVMVLAAGLLLFLVLEAEKLLLRQRELYIDAKAEPQPDP